MLPQVLKYGDARTVPCMIMGLFMKTRRGACDLAAAMSTDACRAQSPVVGEPYILSRKELHTNPEPFHQMIGRTPTWPGKSMFGTLR